MRKKSDNHQGAECGCEEAMKATATTSSPPRDEDEANKTFHAPFCDTEKRKLSPPPSIVTNQNETFPLVSSCVRVAKDENGNL
jgi:hypothetical protein